MKKIINLILAISVLVLCIVFTTSCDSKLEAPDGFRLNEQTLTLNWNKITGALSYTVQISGEEREKTTRSNSISLEYLSAGTYEIKVKAIGNDIDNKDSDWSTYEFVRAAETGLKYQLINSNTEYELISGGTASGNIVIEDYYRGKPVTSIADKALYNNSKITGIVVGSNVKTIGEKAFSKCSALTSIVIPENVTQIGDYAFQSSKSLVSVSLPNSITKINPYMFSWCSALKSITLGNKITEIGNYAFSNCKSLEAISLPDTVATIGEYAFSDCESMTSLNLGKGLRDIGIYAFCNCKIVEKITLPDSLVTISDYAFKNCNTVTEIVIPNSVQKIGIEAFSECEAVSSISIGTGVTSIGAGAFYNTAYYNNADTIVCIDGWAIASKSLEIDNIALPEGVYGIADYAFAGCAKLTQLSFTGIKYVGNYAFYACVDQEKNGLWECIFDNSLLTIGDYVFCYSPISEVKVGNNLKSIGTYTFAFCDLLMTMDIPDSVTSIGGNAFRGTGAYKATQGVVYMDDWAVGVNIPEGSGLMNLVITEGKRGIASYSFYGIPIMGTVIIPDTVEYIGRSAFYASNYIRNLQISANVKYIDDYAFYRCEGATFGEGGYLSLPSTLEYIGRSAFYGCRGITAVSIPSSVKTVSDYAFYNCVSLGIKELSDGTAVDGKLLIANGVQYIGNRAFQGCASLTEITIPESITFLGTHAFYKCTALTTVVFEGSLDNINEYSFFKCKALESLTLPTGLKSIGKYAFRGCEMLNFIDLSSIETIEDYAFYQCVRLSDVVFPSSLKSIGNYAFRSCSGITALMLPSTIEYIGKHAFYGMNNTTIYCESSTVPSTWNERFNTSYRPVFFGCELSDDNSYVVSFTISNTSIENKDALNGISNPTRAGYTFVGWATSNGSSESAYTSETVVNAPAGTTLYAIWTEVINEEVQQ